MDILAKQVNDYLKNKFSKQAENCSISRCSPTY